MFIEFTKPVKEKDIKWEACLEFYSFFFCNKFNKFHNTGEQILDSIYHMTPKNSFEIAFLVSKHKDFATIKQRDSDCEVIICFGTKVVISRSYSYWNA